MTKQTLLQRSNTDRPTSIHLAVLVFCCLPLFNYYGYVLDRSEACIAILATFFSAFFSTRSEKNQPLAVPFALIALAFSPWKILTGLALLPCLVVYGHRWTTKKHSGFLLGILIAGILAAFVWLLDVAAFTPSFQKIRQISPYVVEHAFNLFSVVGLNLYPADSFPLQIGMVIIGVIALIYLTRSKEPLQRGACLSLSASLFLPGLTLAASGAALGLLAVGALSKKAWARMTAVLVLTLFSEVYLVNRWDQYAKLFYRDWLYDPTRTESPAVIAFFIIKLVVLVSIWRHAPGPRIAKDSADKVNFREIWQTWPANCIKAIRDLQHTPRITKVDWVKIFALATASAVLTFYNLGSFSKPETFVSEHLKWNISLAPDQAISDIWIFKSRHTMTMDVVCEQDDTTQTVSFVSLEAYGWSYRKLVAPCKGGAIIETSLEKGGKLFEIYLADGQGRRVQPMEICSADIGSDCTKSVAHQLFDEPNHAMGIPTQFQGTFYDEAFHIEDGIRAAANNHWSINTNPAHPYFGRAMIALSMKSIGAVPFAWRLPEAMSGALLPLSVLILAWRMFGQPHLAFLAAFLVLCDTARLSLSRVATTDSQLCFWIMVQAIGIWEWLKSRVQGQHRSINVHWLIIAGIGLGFAAGIKWSGLFALPVLVAVIALVASVEKKSIQHFLGACLILLGAGFATYGLGYAIVMDKWDVSLVEIIASDAVGMLRFHQHFGGYIPYQSQFIEWPWLNRPVALFAGYGLAPESALKLFIVGNPFVYWAILPAVFLACTTTSAKRMVGNVFALACFLSLFVVWGLIGRLTYLYHFAPIMPFGAIIIASVLHATHVPIWMRRTYVVLVGIGLIIILPVALGLTVPRDLLSMSEWFPEWFGLFDFHTRFSIKPTS